MIVVVDYGIGNLFSIINMLEYLGYAAEISSDPRVIERASQLILPGVGAFDCAMKSLENLDLVGPLNTAVLDRQAPVLGVCLGMQLLGKGSEEGQKVQGLGWIDAVTVRLSPPQGSGLKVPHVGWSEVKPSPCAPLFRHMGPDARFYFTHSYHVQCANESDVAARYDYGGNFCCAISRGNIHGVQFHPEKSHRFGMALLQSFAEMI